MLREIAACWASTEWNPYWLVFVGSRSCQQMVPFPGPRCVWEEGMWHSTNGYPTMDMAPYTIETSILVWSEADRICWSIKSEPWADNKQVFIEVHPRRSTWILLQWISYHIVRVIGVIHIQEDKISRRRTDVLDPWTDPWTIGNWQNSIACRRGLVG